MRTHMILLSFITQPETHKYIIAKYKILCRPITLECLTHRYEYMNNINNYKMDIMLSISILDTNTFDLLYIYGGEFVYDRRQYGNEWLRCYINYDYYCYEKILKIIKTRSDREFYDCFTDYCLFDSELLFGGLLDVALYLDKDCIIKIMFEKLDTKIFEDYERCLMNATSFKWFEYIFYNKPICVNKIIKYYNVKNNFKQPNHSTLIIGCVEHVVYRDYFECGIQRIKMLLERGADINTLSDSTIIKHNKTLANVELVEILLKAGARANIYDNLHQNPYKLVDKLSNSEHEKNIIRELLNTYK